MNVLILGPTQVDYQIIHKIIIKYDCLIAVDKGIEHFWDLGITPDFAIGDFDSVSDLIYGKAIEEWRSKTKFIRYLPEKDKSDFELALDILKKGDTVKAFGFTGGRLDHELSCLFLMKTAHQRGIRLKIIDKNNTCEWISRSRIVGRDELYPYFSIVPLSDMTLKLRGFYYPLNKTKVKMNTSLLLSNKIKAEKALIRIYSGEGMVIRSRDRI